MGCLGCYGEANLKAYPNLNGQYQLDIPSVATRLPSCLQKAGAAAQATLPLLLTLQQSGTYLNAGVTPLDVDSEPSLEQIMVQAGKQRPTLTGKWHQQAFILHGKIPNWDGCSTDSRGNVAMVLSGQWDQGRLAGKIQISTVPGNLSFTGTRLGP